jgi:hypothetical protein
VLLALRDGYPHELSELREGSFYFRFDSPELGVDWNLRSDNLGAQNDETKQFLIELLVND